MTGRRLVYISRLPCRVFVIVVAFFASPRLDRDRRHNGPCLFANARVLTPYEQAVGQWNVTLRRNGWLSKRDILSPLFPAVHKQSHDHTTLPDKNKMNCQLDIFPNGTFAMTPMEGLTAAPTVSSTLSPIAHTNNNKSSLSSSSCNLQKQQRLLLMRGQWIVQPNPYCITDRHYDELVLTSYPRVEKRVSDDAPLQRVTLRLQCRVWGRYSSGPVRRLMNYDNKMRRRRRSSRMTHGTVLWNVEESSSSTSSLPWWKSRRVCASFTARPADVRSPSLSSDAAVAQEEQVQDVNDDDYDEFNEDY